MFWPSTAMKAGRLSLVSKCTWLLLKVIPLTCRSHQPYDGLVPCPAGCQLLVSGGLMLTSEAGCPPGTVRFTLVMVTFWMGTPTRPLMVLVNSPRELRECTAVTLEMLMLRMMPTGGGGPPQLPRAPVLIQIGTVVPDMVMVS